MVVTFCLVTKSITYELKTALKKKCSNESCPFIVILFKECPHPGDLRENAGRIQEIKVLSFVLDAIAL
ncbi:hypothetical protein DRN46_05170 [Thermococci archaeon]|nr:MAG: hypothetical protein DRN46_05170 [Thermococci archaeon]